MKLSVGDIVTWTSQANGSTIEKRGEVVIVLPAGKQRRHYMNQPAGSWDLSPMNGAQQTRNHESYLVLVRPAKGNAKPKLYWPMVKALVREAMSVFVAMEEQEANDDQRRTYPYRARLHRES